MMQLTHVSHEQLEPGVVLLEAEVGAEDVASVFRQVYNDFSKQVRLPGFRKGKVPREILQQRVGRDAIRQEAINRLAQPAYEAALEQSGLETVEQVSFEVVEIDESIPFHFKTKLVTRPPVLLGDYESLWAEKPKIEISDEQVQEQLETLRRRHAQYLPLEGRSLQYGDLVWGTLQVTVLGGPEPEKPSAVRPFIIGDNGMVPSLDEFLLGHGEDETVEPIVTYPDDFPEKNLAGTSARARFEIEGCREQQLPDLDDEFATQMGEFSTLEELRSEIRRALEQHAVSAAMKSIEADLVRQAVDRSVVTIPEVLTERRSHRRLEEIESRLKEQQTTLEAYLESLDSTLDDLKSKVRDQVAFETRKQYVLEEIAEKEQVLVTEDELSEHVRKMAKAMRESPAALRKRLQETDSLDIFRGQLRKEKAARLLLQRSGAVPEAADEDDLDLTPVDELGSFVEDIGAENAPAGLQAEEVT